MTEQEKAYVKAQADWIRKVKLKTGDRVKVLLAPVDSGRNYGGWKAFFASPDKACSIGTIMYVAGDWQWVLRKDPTYGITLCTTPNSKNGNFYPFHYLVKIEDDEA